MTPLATSLATPELFWHWLIALLSSPRHQAEERWPLVAKKNHQFMGQGWVPCASRNRHAHFFGESAGSLSLAFPAHTYKERRDHA